MKGNQEEWNRKSKKYIVKEIGRCRKREEEKGREQKINEEI